MAKIVNSSELEEIVKNSEDIVLVDFYADWCAPCKMLLPIIDSIDESGVTVLKVNIDENPDSAHTYEVLSIPTVVVIKNGVMVDSIKGAVPKAKLIDLINNHK